MIENDLIRFDEKIWGYRFACRQCGAEGSTEGEAPISAINAMQEKGWTFQEQGEKFTPFCPGCPK